MSPSRVRIRVFQRPLWIALLILCATNIQAQLHWGDITPKDCSAPGLREWSGILWDIPEGETWDDVCLRTRAIEGGRPPDRCATILWKSWGMWDVPDPGCHDEPRENQELILDLSMRNGLPNEAVEVEYIIEHVDQVGRYTIVPPPEKARVRVPYRQRDGGRRRIPVPYQGGTWTVHARVWSTGRATNVVLGEFTKDIPIPFNPHEEYDPSAGFYIRLRTAGGYEIGPTYTR